MNRKALAPLEPAQAAQFGHGDVASQHELHTRHDWSDAALAGILDAYPRERLGVFLTGESPHDRASWRRGLAGSLSGAELMRRVHDGRIWLNLRASNDCIPAIAAIEADIVADLAADAPNVKTYRRDLGLLISSPRAQVLYHFDVAMVALFHLRGHKRFYLYPPSPPFLTEDMVERAVLRLTDEMGGYRDGFDDAAQVIDMAPGDWVSWAQNSPHRIVNGDDVNVSISMEFLTARAALRANQYYANGVLRRSLGASPRLRPDYSAAGLGKALLARGVKALRPKPASEPWTPQFDLSRPDAD